MLAPNGSPRVVSDNNLIDGKMHFDCSTVAPGDKTPCTNNAGIAKFKFQTGKTHRLRLVNTGADGVQRFSIDQHMLTVIAEDFVAVKPYNTSVVTLGVGQRADVLVTAKVGKPNSAFWMRSNLTSCTETKQPYAVAAVYYDQADTSATPSSRAWNVPDPGTCANDDLAIAEPLYPIALPDATFTHTMDIELFKNASDVTLWKFNGVSMRTDYNSPVLPLAAQGNFSYPPEWNVVNFHENTSIRLVINNKSPSAYEIYPSRCSPGESKTLVLLTKPMIQTPHASPRPQLLHPPRGSRCVGRHYRSAVQPAPPRRRPGARQWPSRDTIRWSPGYDLLPPFPFPFPKLTKRKTHRCLGLPLPRRVACLGRLLRITDRAAGQGEADEASGGCGRELQGVGPVVEMQCC
jgi:hypothetical protein